MKLNELNKIEEGIFSAIKDRFQQGGYQTNVQNIFIKDFVQDAITSLNNGIKGGLIDPNTKSTGTSSNVNFGNTTPTNVGPATGAAGSNVTSSNTTNPLRAPTVSGAPRTSVSTRVSPGGTSGTVTTGGAGMSIRESSYNKMNRVFESIININEQTELRTISEFMMDWFSQYMQGVNWDSSKAIVQQKLKKLQDDYPKNVNQNLTDLARMGLALSKAGSPAGAPKEFTQAKQAQSGSVEDLKGALEGLAKTDPKAYNELIKNLKPAPTAPTTTTESRRRR